MIMFDFHKPVNCQARRLLHAATFWLIRFIVTTSPKMKGLTTLPPVSLDVQGAS